MEDGMGYLKDCHIEHSEISLFKLRALVSRLPDFPTSDKFPLARSLGLFDFGLFDSNPPDFQTFYYLWA